MLNLFKDGKKMKKTRFVALLLVIVLAISMLSLADMKTVTLHRGYAAGAGERSFVRALVLTSEDKVLAAHIEEFTYTKSGEKVVPVPNFDVEKGMKAGSKEDMTLISKRSDLSYSEMMKEYAKATLTVGENLDIIQNFVAGKTIAELEEILAKAEPNKAIDAITGATATSAPEYIRAIVETAKSDKFASSAELESVEGLSIKAQLGAAHGTKSFADIGVVLSEGKVVLASIDEFQFMAGEGVPASAGKFGEGYADNASPLASKLVNAEQYSKKMSEKAKSTVSLGDNYKAIESFAIGKTGAEILDFAGKQEKGKAVDAVTGATLVDTVGYLTVLGQAASN